MVDILKLEGNVVTSSMNDKIWLFYGAPGTWKTTTATGNREKTLLGAFEIGYKFIPGVKAVNLTNWHGLKDLIRQLDSPKAHEMYETFVLDTVGLAYKACIAYICAKKGVSEIGEIPYGLGYTLAKNEFEKTLSMIPQMGYGLVMIAHSDELNDEKSGVSIKVDIDKRPSGVIKGMADFILFARKEPKDGSETGEMSVYGYTETRNPNIEVKTRARFFPKRIDFTYEAIQKALKKAVEEQDKFFGTESSSEANFDVYQETEVDIKSIQEEITSLAKELFSTPFADKAQAAIEKELNGVRISQTTKAHLASLYSLRDELISIKKSM